MFEFEMPGDIHDLEKMERELCEHMGFGNKQSIVDKDYLEWCEYFDLYDGEELSHKHEEAMCKNWQGRVCMIKNFPNSTSPFWNMKQNGDGTAAKIDVIISGQETIGSAERSSDPIAMREQFHSISEGMYADLLFEKFGQGRVEQELEDFLSLNFVPRVGGGIGITRLLHAMNDYSIRQVIQNMH
tara:strand:- start:36 stop:590 length:555 start_codon:yes stop_codon:yes gene_type:complete